MMNMHDNMPPFYLNDYINKLISQLKSDVEFLSQGLHSTYKVASKRDVTNLQWQMAATKNSALDLQHKLEELDKEIEKLNDKKV